MLKLISYSVCNKRLVVTIIYLCDTIAKDDYYFINANEMLINDVVIIDIRWYHQ